MHPVTIKIPLAEWMGAQEDFAVGVLSVYIIEAKGLKNVEVTGKSDPYVRILLGGAEVCRTRAIDNK